MKILTVVHRFPPRHHAGAELYSYRLARKLTENGHRVVVMTADDAIFRRNHGTRRYRLGKIEVEEVINHRRFSSFSETHVDSTMDQRFYDLLRRERPDVVHFQHLLHHSTNYPLIARQEGIPTAMTLHEYWLMCARNGQLIRADHSRCDQPSLDKCSRCMTNFMWGRSGVDVWALRGVTAVRRVTGVNLKAAARRVRLRQFTHIEETLSEDAITDMRKELVLREGRMRDVFASVDVFIAPSRFLAERFVTYGLPSDQIVHSDYGTPIELFEPTSPRTDGPLRIGFLGSVQPVKGVHVLLAALEKLTPGTFRAFVYGDMRAKPEYRAELEQRLTEDVEIPGLAKAEEIPGILREFDVLVVPSIWWENSPLVIHEAFAAGVPVVCSDIGGMAELVADGKSGLHFAAGDSEALASRLRQLIDDRDLLARLRTGIPRLGDMVSDAGFHERLFQALIDG